MRQSIARRGRQLVLLLYVAALLGAVSMVIGPALNDRNIAADPGRALATVTGVSWLRTTIDYRDEEGIYHSPPTGLLYPTGLGEGQRVWVTYAKSDPDLVKVEGRAWTLSLIPACSVALVTTVIAAVLWWALGRATRPRASSPKVSPELS
ncbi:DUF3592 domain-containing protein [Corynebacterium nasicanis]|uniref:DUF3592 domain-containing protein n=1 Tax=Corynebacterium nasicanis TaxID=1448267 RepID=A0ABW1QFP4_9CORY